MNKNRPATCGLISINNKVSSEEGKQRKRKKATENHDDVGGKKDLGSAEDTFEHERVQVAGYILRAVSRDGARRRPVGSCAFCE